MKLRKFCFNKRFEEYYFYFLLYRVDDPLIVPFTKESPFLIPFMRTFASMRRVGVLSDIIKSYKSQEVKQCSSGLVCHETLKLVRFVSFRLLSNFLFQISLGFKHLMTPILIFVVGMFVSIGVAMMEKFIKSKTIKRKVDDVQIIEQPLEMVRGYITDYFKNNDLHFRNDQVNELKEFLDASLIIIQEYDKNFVEDN